MKDVAATLKLEKTTSKIFFPYWVMIFEKRDLPAITLSINYTIRKTLKLRYSKILLCTFLREPSNQKFWLNWFIASFGEYIRIYRFEKLSFKRILWVQKAQKYRKAAILGLFLDR